MLAGNLLLLLLLLLLLMLSWLLFFVPNPLAPTFLCSVVEDNLLIPRCLHLTLFLAYTCACFAQTHVRPSLSLSLSLSLARVSAPHFNIVHLERRPFVERYLFVVATSFRHAALSSILCEEATVPWMPKSQIGIAAT